MAAAVTTTSSTTSTLSPRGVRIVGAVFVAFAALFIAVGIGIAATQGGKLRGFQAVPATVTGTGVVSQRGSKGGTTYAPRVDFTYQVAGATHVAHTPFPLAIYGSGDWAQELVASYHVGQQLTAWYNPAAPGEAYLEHKVDIFPYCFILFPMVHVAVGLAIMLFSGRSPGAPLSAASKAARLGAIAGCWITVGGLAGWHFARIGGDFSGWNLGIFAIYAVPGVGLALACLGYARAAARAAPAENSYAVPGPE